jgi:hypothetical protein
MRIWDNFYRSCMLNSRYRCYCLNLVYTLPNNSDKIKGHNQSNLCTETRISWHMFQFMLGGIHIGINCIFRLNKNHSQKDTFRIMNCWIKNRSCRISNSKCLTDHRYYTLKYIECKYLWNQAHILVYILNKILHFCIINNSHHRRRDIILILRRSQHCSWYNYWSSWCSLYNFGYKYHKLLLHQEKRLNSSQCILTDH